MAYNDDLLPTESDGKNNGNGDGIKSTGSGSGSDSSAGIVGRIPIGSASGSDSVGGTSRRNERMLIETGDGSVVDPLASVVLPDSIGSESGGNSRVRRRRNQTGSRGNQGNGSETGSTVTDSGSAEGEKESIPPASPRPVRVESLKSGSAKSSAADVLLTDKFVTEVWGIVFSGAAVVFKDPNWKVDEDDASDLATRTIALLKSIDTKNAAKLEKKIAKYAPSLSLLMGLAAVVGPRIAHTREMKRGNLPKENPSANGSNPVAPASPVANPSGPVASRASGNGNGQPDKFAIAPLRRNHWPEVFGRDDV